MTTTAEKQGAAEREPEAAREAQAEGHGRARTCVGCGERVALGAAGAASPSVGSAGHAGLVRLILGPGGVVAVDPGDGGFGRGAHVHPRPDCLAKAAQRGLARANRGRIEGIHVAPEGQEPAPAEGAAPAEDASPAQLTPATLARAIRQAMNRRIQGLIRAAVRSRAAAIGADAASAALERGAPLCVVACDAAAGAAQTQVQAAIAAGRAVAWGTKVELGALAGGQREQGVAVLAITSGRLAAAVAEAVQIADACAAAERGAPGTRPRGGKPPQGERDRDRGRGDGGPEEAPRAADQRGGVRQLQQERATKSLQQRATRRMDGGARSGTANGARRTGNVERGA